MSVYFERAINQRADIAHCKLPEYSGCGKDLLIVPEGEMRMGGIHNRFISKRFSVCSAFIFSDELYNTYGMIHIYPGQEIDTLGLNLISKNHKMMGLIIEGSGARDKSRIFNQIVSRLNIIDLKRIDVDTSFNKSHLPFHIIYRPSENIVLAARISHEDYLEYSAF